MTPRKKVWVTNLNKGMIQRRVSKMEYPIDALMYGLNFDLSDGSLLTRPGYDVVTGANFPAGIVRMIKQVRFPKSSSSCLLVQVQYQNVDYLYASITQLPSTSLSWERVYTFDTDPGTCAVAVLGDRAIITAPRTVPLVFSGGLKEDGSDWAFPIHVLVSEDSGDTPQWIGDEALDIDPKSTLPIGTIGSNGTILVRSDIPKLEGIRMEFLTPNTSSDPLAESVFITCYLDDDIKVDLFDLTQGEITNWDTAFRATSTETGNSTPPTDTNSASNVTVFDTYCPVPYQGRITKVGFASQSTGNVKFKIGVFYTPNYVYYIEDLETFNKTVTGYQEFTLSTPYEVTSLYGVIVGVYFADSHSKTYQTSGGLALLTASGDITGNSLAFTYYSEYWSGIHATYDTPFPKNMGRFTDGVDPVSIGSGGTCKYINPGNRVNMGSLDYEIKSIAGNGTGVGAIVLDQTTTETSVDSIEAGEFNQGTLVSLPAENYGAPVATYVRNSTVEMRGYSIRQKISGADLLAGGDNIQIKFAWNGDCLGYWYHPNTIIGGASIGQLDTGANTVDNPVPFTFNGGQQTCSITSGSSVITDTLNFTISTSNDYLICYEVALDPNFYQPLNSVYYHGGFLDASAGAGVYYRLRQYRDSGGNYHTLYSPSYLQKTVTGFDYRAGLCFGVSEVRVVPDAPTEFTATAMVDEYNAVDVTYATEVTVIATCNVPSGTEIYLAMSFDGGDVFKAWCSSAWREIAKDDSGTWKYNTSATSTPTWVASTVNSDLGALQDAFAISYNQMTLATMEGMSTGDWASTGGFQSGTTTSITPAFYLSAGSLSTPNLQDLVFSFGAGGTPVTIHSGGTWKENPFRGDGTVISDIAFAQDGIIGISTRIPADHYFLHGIPGFWFQIEPLTMDAATSLSRLSYKAPIQPLQSIGIGRFSPCLAFTLVQTSTGATRDYAIEVSDETYVSYADCPMTTAHKLYVGGLQQFNSILIIPSIYNNTNTATLSAEYWDGTSWQSATIYDGTAVSGKCFAQTGYVTVTVPADWKQCTPIANADRGYYLRFSVSAALTDTTRIVEAKLTLIPRALTPYEFVASFSDRVALVSSPSAPDETAISGPFAEYDWTSANSGLYRIGGPDRPIAVLDAWGTLLIAKPNGWYRLDLNTFKFVGHETPFVPTNGQVVVKAPMAGTDGTRSALYFLGNEGAYAFAGLFLDNVDDAARPLDISQFVNYWDPEAIPRIDRNNLWRACGAAWKDFVLWAVPMIIDDQQSEQTSNNRIIAYNTRTGTWISPMDISATTLAPAYAYSADSPSKMGRPILYAGDSSGNIMQLFDDNDDNGSYITATGRSGTLAPDGPGVYKDLLKVRVYGTATGSVLINLYINYEDEPRVSKYLGDLVDANGIPKTDFITPNLEFRTLEWEIVTTGIAEITALEFQYQPLHQDEGE